MKGDPDDPVEVVIKFPDIESAVKHFKDNPDGFALYIKRCVWDSFADADNLDEKELGERP